MINLYGKIFLGFWLCMIAIIASWFLANRYVEDYPDSPAVEKSQPPRPDGPGLPPGTPPPRKMYRIYYGIQNLEAQELPAWIKLQEKQQDIRIFLVDQNQIEVFDKPLLDGTEEVIARLGRFRRRAHLRLDDYNLFAQRLHRQEWGSLTMVVASYPPRSPIIKLLTEHLWLRLLLAILISGLISYLVSRYLTRPLKQLQQAARELAEGKLDTRIPVPASGGDETTELARAFNSMAGELQQRIQAQKRLLHDVSHELRSPLARLRVAIALAERDPAQSAAHLQRMERETERLDELIGQLLASPDSRLPLDDSLDLVGLLQELVEDARFEIQGSHKKIQLSIPAEEAIVQTHGDLLKKAFENVLRNALHYTAEESTVTVALQPTEHKYLLSFEDQGPGIPEAELEQIFEPFYRVDTVRQRETGGFGLGLAIARRAIEQHDGAIRAENTSSGLRVVIELPR